VRRLTVLLTRPEGRNEELARRLRELGFEVAVEPLVSVEPLGDEPVDVGAYDWVVVTSITGARELRRRMVGTPARVAAIGHATADAFGGADLVSRVSTQEGLLAELPRPTGRVLFAGAERARRLLVEALEADFRPLYRTLELRPDALPAADLVVLASPSAVRALARVSTHVPVVSIGPQTTAAAHRAGMQVVAEARTHDLDGLVAAVAKAAR
jgi:uroporphyrinogen-III synthase